MRTLLNCARLRYAAAPLVVALCCPLALAQQEGEESEDQKTPSRGAVGVSVEPLENEAVQVGEPTGDAQRAERFAKYMTGAKLSGRFTMLDSQSDDLPSEEYTVVKCEKLDKPNMYRFTAKIKYGDTDMEVPMELPVYFAGDTPVISLTDLSIPQMGTFSARVVIYRGSYAGTWSHDDKGGHLFGTIESDYEGELPASAETSDGTTKRVKKGPVGVTADTAEDPNSGN